MRTLLELTKVRLTAMVALSAATGYVLFARRIDAGIVLPALGLFLLAAGAAALNQVQEASIDARMARTRGRPIPSGRISRAGAFYVAGLLILSGASALASLDRHPLEALAAGGFALVWYNGVYTPLKRVTAFAAVPGALIGALPPVAGYMAAGGDPRDPSILLVAGFFFVWQIPHFWLLMASRGEQYEAAGLPTLGRTFEPPQLRRLTFAWMLSSAAAGTLLPLLAHGRIGTAWSAGMVAASALLGVGALDLLRPPPGTDPFRRAFLRINLYAMAVMACLALNALEG
jgi:protoheme IX farnesyltransferase